MGLNVVIISCKLRITLSIIALVLSSVYCWSSDQGYGNYYQQKIDVDLWDKSLQDAITQLTSRSSLDFLAASDIAKPEGFAKIKTFIQARNVSAIDAAEWIARSINSRYRIKDNGTTVIFTSSYHWLDEEKPAAKFYNIGGLLDWKDQKEFTATIKELLKVYAIKDPEYSIRIRSSDQRLFAYLPDTLQERLIAVLRVLSSKGKKAVKQKSPDYIFELKKKLSAPIIFDYKNTEAGHIITDLALQGDVNIGISSKTMQKIKNIKLTASIPYGSLSDGLEMFCQKVDLAGISYDPPSGIWLTGNKHEVGRINGSRQILWENVPVRSFYIKDVISKTDLQKLLKNIKNKISSDTRNDPSVSVAYYKYIGNLIVIAPAADQIRIENFLASLPVAEE